MAIQIERKQLKHVDKRLRDLFDRGAKALLQKNYGYAVEMFRTVLRAEPGITEVRSKLREAQLGRVNNKASIGRALGTYLLSLPTRAKAKAAVKAENFSKALDLAEGVMTMDPTSVFGSTFIANIAEEVEVPEIGINALECAKPHHPDSVMLLSRLTKAYKQADMNVKALECMTHICSVSKHDKWKKERKELVALAHMTESNMIKAEKGEANYQDMIKDKDQAVSLEQEAATFRSKDDMAQQIRSLEQLVDGRDSGVNRQKLANAYRQAERWQDAVDNFEKALEMLDGFDPGVYTHITNCKSKLIDEEVSNWRSAVADGSTTIEDAEDNIEAWEAERLRLMLERWSELVKRLPSEVRARNTLANYQLKADQISEALGNFQIVKKNPSLRQEASLKIGQCLSLQGKHDLAIVELQQALEGMRNMDSIKKGTLYQLGKEYEMRGDQVAADDCFKKIYSTDMNFRDVQQIVEDIYKRDQGDEV